ncbi:hypothetical protein [Sphingopyxis sp. PET50]|uniref:hypothetical protein n=1 Tax=Sphingopyxis sp. PET50 TaxID=2976533 RepID=UPI0021AE3AEB|nr:hypothetical protein [Sphingopyxis sp. PET50]
MKEHSKESIRHSRDEAKRIVLLYIENSNEQKSEEYENKILEFMEFSSINSGIALHYLGYFLDNKIDLLNFIRKLSDKTEKIHVIRSINIFLFWEIKSIMGLR